LDKIFASLSEADISHAPDQAAALIVRVREAPLGPGAFGLYTDLVEFLMADDVTSAKIVIDALFAEVGRGVTSDLRPVTLDDGDLGPGQADRYRRLLDDDADVPIDLLPVAGDIRRRAEEQLAASMSLIERAAPELADEIRALIREVVLVASSSDAGENYFHGGSTFYLWGALFLNASVHADRVNMAMRLTHEAGHMLLFGMSLGARLVDNLDDERFASPLRRDPRPMDGIVHAIYVLARMTYCLHALVDSDLLKPQERETAQRQLDDQRRSYSKTLAEIEPHIQFTEAGAAIFEQARSFMANQ
jgi:HEXXH motif-containing protein